MKPYGMIQHGYMFESFCERLSPVQFKLLIGIARQGGREIQHVLQGLDSAPGLLNAKLGSP